MNGVSFAREGEQREERAKSSREKNGRVVTVRETNGTTFHMENECADSFLHPARQNFAILAKESSTDHPFIYTYTRLK